MIGTVIAAGVTVTKMAKDMKKSDELKEQAAKKRKRAYRAVSEAEADRMYEEEKMEQAVLRLVTRKKGILTTSITRFIDVYKEIKKIQFRESDGIKELDNFSLACCDNMQKNAVIIQQKDFSPSGITKNVLKGFLFTGILGATTASIVDDAQNELNMARDRAKQAQVIAEQQKIYSLSYQAIRERAEHMTEILTELNLWFVKSINNTEKLIQTNGQNRESYTSDDILQIGTCLNLAKAVKDILDAPILDKDGKLAEETLHTIEMGNQCVIDMKNKLAEI